MPTGGVGSHFVALLGAERASATRRAIVLGVVAVLLAPLAYFVLPWQGLVVHALALLGGLLAGNLWSRRRVTRFEASLRGTWKSWMRWSVASETVPDLYRRVTGAGNRNGPYLAASALTVLWALEVGLLLLAFQDTTATWVAVPVLLLNGLVPGVLVADALRMRTWTRQFADSVSDLVASGEIGVWGVL